MSSLKRGILLSVEGIDGSGKSTLAKKIKSLLEKNNFPVLLTYEPGDTRLGKEIRKILQEREFDICGKAEFLLFASDRAQHFTEVIIPHLKQKKIILSDRMADSSVAYQGYGRGENIEMIHNINKWAMQNREPDLIFYIQVSFESAIARLEKRKETPTVFEKEEKAFIKKLITGFDEILKQKKNVILLDGEQPADIVAEDAYKKLITWIEKKNLTI